MVKQAQDSESSLSLHKHAKDTVTSLSATKDAAIHSMKLSDNSSLTYVQGINCFLIAADAYMLTSRHAQVHSTQPTGNAGGSKADSFAHGTNETDPVMDDTVINVPNKDKSQNEDDHAESAESATVSLHSPDSPMPGLSTPDDWPQNIKYVPPDVLHRLLAFMKKDDPKNKCYSLANIPSNAKWGSASPNNKFLCVDNKPITIWALANVESTWFMDLDRNPHGRVNLGFRLPFSGDNLHADHLYLKANPPLNKDCVKFSGRYMKHFEKGSKTATIVPFEAIYDTTHHFKAKSKMAMISLNNIGKRDIVLVESNFARWKEGEAKKIRKWTEWKAGFDLHVVSLLFEAPPGMELEPDAPRVDDPEDDL